MSDISEFKCVMVLDADQPAGVRANTAAILGITLGAKFPALVGPDAPDGDGTPHPGIIMTPVPILKGDQAGLRALRDKLADPKFAPVWCADFSDTAQCCQTYPVYLDHARQTPEADYHYLGLLLCGEKKLVNKLTGSLPLLR